MSVRYFPEVYIWGSDILRGASIQTQTRETDKSVFYNMVIYTCIIYAKYVTLAYVHILYVWDAAAVYLTN